MKLTSKEVWLFVTPLLAASAIFLLMRLDKYVIAWDERRIEQWMEQQKSQPMAPTILPNGDKIEYRRLPDGKIQRYFWPKVVHPEARRVRPTGAAYAPSRPKPKGLFDMRTVMLLVLASLCLALMGAGMMIASFFWRRVVSPR